MAYKQGGQNNSINDEYNNSSVNNKLNFNSIIFEIVIAITRARINGFWAMYVEAVGTLEDTLVFHGEQSKQYLKRKKELEKEFEKLMEKLPDKQEAPEEYKQESDKLTVEKANRKYASLMLLIGEQNLGPEFTIVDEDDYVDEAAEPEETIDAEASE